MARWVVAVFFSVAALISSAAAQREPGQGAPPASETSKEPVPESLDKLFDQLGLFGTWALNCAQPPSPANPHVSITLLGEGVVVEAHDIGPDFATNRYSVLAAQRLPGERLSVKAIFQPGTPTEERQNLIFLLHGTTRRTLFNQPEGRPARVKDGIAVGIGVRTPVLKKCG